jgi:hypothetical protein
VKTVEYKFHEAANIFPLDEDNINALADDIKKNGQQIAIELYHGKVLDGRRRMTACRIAGVEPIINEVNPADPVAYVLSLNLHRRHLTPSQLSMVAARAREVYDKQAKERMQAGGGDRKSSSRKSGKENFPDPICQQARDAAGKAVGVSGKSVDHATRVIEHAIPEVVKAVDEGRMSVSSAAILSAEPPEVQLAEATDPKRNRKYTPVTGGGKILPEEEKDELPEGERRGIGMIQANEAVNALTKIPKNDGLRKRGFQFVMDFIKRNS